MATWDRSSWTQEYLNRKGWGGWSPWAKGYAGWYSPMIYGESPEAWGATPNDAAAGKRAAQQQSYAWLLSSALPFVAPSQAEQLWNAMAGATAPDVWANKENNPALAALKDINKDEKEGWSGWGATEAKQGEAAWRNFYDPRRLEDAVNMFTELEAFDGVAEQPREARLWLSMDRGVRDWVIRTLAAGRDWYKMGSRDARDTQSAAIQALLGTSFGADIIPENQLTSLRTMLQQMIGGGRQSNPWANVGFTPFGYSGANQRYG